MRSVRRTEVARSGQLGGHSRDHLIDDGGQGVLLHPGRVVGPEVAHVRVVADVVADPIGVVVGEIGTLATRCGGPESVVHEGVGRLVPVDDVPALAEGLAWMHRHAADFDPEALRQDALRRFGPAAVAGQLQTVYSKALAQRGAR